MHLSQIELTNYRNHNSLNIAPHAKWNCITGLNGSGKTNVLDAIYMLCLLKSFAGQKLQNCIRLSSDFYRLVGHFHKEKLDEIVIKHPINGLREVFKNAKKYKKLTAHIGHFPILLIQPIDDYRLLEGAHARRKLLDQAIGQVDQQYLNALITYNKLLKQRNALLKHMKTSGRFDQDAVHVYDNAMSEHSNVIINGRKVFLQKLKPKMDKYYAMISENSEQANISYKQDIEVDKLEQTFQGSLYIDRASGRTSRGPHKDDIDMMLNELPLREGGSQGQRKSFLIAIKLAIYEFLSQESGTLPILLLDDLFDKLDNRRVANLLSLIATDTFGQVFITDKDDVHLISIMKELNLDHKHLQLT